MNQTPREKRRPVLILTPLEGIPLIQKGQNLTEIILDSLIKNAIDLIDGDILVIAQKIVSKAEGRLFRLKDITPTQKALHLAEETGKDPRLVELIMQESKAILRSREGLIIAEHKLGFVCANAGIDRSNIRGDESDQGKHVLLLPENPDRSAERLRLDVEKHMGVDIGILIIDSHGRAWRNGVVGVSIGLSGVPGIVDMRGKEDIFGYKLRVTQIAAADELAAGASLVMGQADETIPVVHVRGFPYELREGSFSEIPRKKKNDLFR
jgi:coenzyme F420-0:L-glutamate ligase/coenzyme F420-1:gamma-L-glutamate ligase